MDTARNEHQTPWRAVLLVMSLFLLPIVLMAQSTLTSPAPGTTLAGPSVTFSWSASTAATGYYLLLGSTGTGSQDLYASAELNSTNTTVSGLPVNGETIFARLCTVNNGSQTCLDYTYTASNQAAMISPVPGSGLPGPSVPFTWSAAAGATGYYLQIGSTGVGSDDIYNSEPKTVTSYTFPSMPTNGETVYVRLTTNYSGTWVHNDYTYKAARQQAKMISPAPGTVLSGPSVPFSWSTAAGATGYYLQIGSTGVGSDDIYNSALKTVTSYTFSTLPTNGETIYVRLTTNYSGNWTPIDYTYTASTQAAITSPAAGTVLTGLSVPFSWSAAAGATGYYLQIGSTGVGSDDIYNSAPKTVTSYTFPSMPTNGETIYVRLTTNYSGAWVHNDYTYTTSSQAAMISPTPGSVFSGASVPFSWSAATGATGYYLQIGSTGVGSDDIYNSALKTVTSYTFPSMPTNGETVYVRLTTNYSGAWVHNDYTYKASGAAALSSLSCTSASMTGAGNLSCAVSLTASTASAMAVSLSSGSSSVTLPTAVTVPANASSVGFTAAVSPVGSAATLILTASAGSISKTFSLQLNADVPTLAVSTSGSPSTYGNAVTFTANISSGPTGGITFYDGSTPMGNGIINGTVASITPSSLIGGSHSITANWSGNSSYAAVSSAAITQVVNKAAPAITWASPASIGYGTALSTTQLDSTSTIAGTFSYSPAAGTVLTAGSHILTATFTPTDTTDYATATSTVSITVNAVTPTITWSSPASIGYGTALSATQLDATSTVPGTFVYLPAAGAILAVGSQTLSAVFTPTDATDYESVTQTVTLIVVPTSYFVQQAGSLVSSGTNASSLSFTANTLAGDLILVAFDFSASATPSSVTDTQGDTFTPVGNQLISPAGTRSVVYYAKNIKGGADTVTISLSANSADIELYLTEYTGLDPTNPIDVLAGSTGNAGPVSSGAATTTFAGDVIYGYCLGDSICFGGSGFVTRSTFDGNRIEDQTAGNPGSYAATGSATSGWTMQMVALKPAVSGSTVSAPAITSATSASGTVGGSFSYQIQASNTPTSFGATGLPAGLTVSSATGLISGTPTSAGSSAVTLSATNSAGTGNATLTISIVAAAPQLSINVSGSIGFGSVALNTMSTQTVTLTSVGGSSVTVSSATVTGTGFSLAGSSFSATLAPGQSATLGVQFDPTTAGAATGQLTITSNSSTNSTVAISLTGTGSNTAYSVVLSWDPPTQSTDPVAGYNIYRAVSGSSTYQLLNPSVDSQTAFTDSTVQSGDSYDYEIESVDSSGVESTPSGPIVVVIP